MRMDATPSVMKRGGRFSAVSAQRASRHSQKIVCFRLVAEKSRHCDNILSTRSLNFLRMSIVLFLNKTLPDKSTF